MVTCLKAVFPLLNEDEASYAETHFTVKMVLSSQDLHGNQLVQVGTCKGTKGDFETEHDLKNSDPKPVHLLGHDLLR